MYHRQSFIEESSKSATLHSKGTKSLHRMSFPFYMVAGHKKHEITFNSKSKKEVIKNTMRKEVDFYEKIKRITETYCGSGFILDDGMESFDGDHGILSAGPTSCLARRKGGKEPKKVQIELFRDELANNFDQETIDLFIKLSKFLPQYYGPDPDGSSRINPQSESLILKNDEKEHFIILENLLFPFLDNTLNLEIEERICILDLKLGSQLHEPSASSEKKEKMYRKSIESTSSTLSLRICGMRVLGTDYSREYCLNLTKDNFVSHGLDAFFKYASKEIKDSIIKQIKDLKRIYRDLNFRIRCFSASLLIIYNADIILEETSTLASIESNSLLKKPQESHPFHHNDDHSNSSTSVKPVVRMIDFAHSFIFETKQDLERETQSFYSPPFDMIDHCAEDTNVLVALDSILTLLAPNKPK